MYRELPYGKFARVLTLPEGIDADKVKLAYKNGVLEICMPMPPQMVSKKIPIEVRSEGASSLMRGTVLPDYSYHPTLRSWICCGPACEGEPEVEIPGSPSHHSSPP